MSQSDKVGINYTWLLWLATSPYIIILTSTYSTDRYLHIVTLLGWYFHKMSLPQKCFLLQITFFDKIFQQKSSPATKSLLYKMSPPQNVSCCRCFVSGDILSRRHYASGEVLSQSMGLSGDMLYQGILYQETFRIRRHFVKGTFCVPPLPLPKKILQGQTNNVSISKKRSPVKMICGKFIIKLILI